MRLEKEIKRVKIWLKEYGYGKRAYKKQKPVVMIYDTTIKEVEPIILRAIKEEIAKRERKLVV